MAEGHPPAAASPAPPPTTTIDVDRFLEEWEEAALNRGLTIETLEVIDSYPLVVAFSWPYPDQSGLYLSAGIHGDEPAGPLALLEAVRGGLLSADTNLVLFPLLNPTGASRGTRENSRGLDLNRDYRQPVSIEVQAHVRWLLEHGFCYRAVLGCHEDWECGGGYLYELNPEGAPSLCPSLLEALAPICGVETTATIDGWPTNGEGVIHPPSETLQRPLWPESIFLVHHFTRLSYTVETPSSLPLQKRIAAQLEAIRGFLG